MGRGARLRAGRRARVGDPERRALGARLRDRRPAARRRPRRPATTRPRTSSPSSPSGCVPRIRDALVISEMGAAGLPPAARVGPRRDVARQPPPRAARRADRRAGRLLRGVRRLDGAHRRRARAGRRARGIVACAQNHDQVGNRALGDRLPPTRSGASRRRSSSSARSRRSSSRARSTARPAPFQFFTDHIDPFIADATREGRRREFAALRRLRGEVPDPQDAATFERSKLTPASPRSSYARLLRLRRELPRELEVAVRRGGADARAPPRPRDAARRLRERDRRARRVRVWPGKPFPLGPSWDGEGTNFSLFSEHAEKVELCLFDDDDRETRYELTERTAFNWHGYLPGVGPGPALRLPRPRAAGRRSRATASTRTSS